jgi:hypothetical protein
MRSSSSLSSSPSLSSSLSSSSSSSSSSLSSVRFADDVRVKYIEKATVDMTSDEINDVWYSREELERQRRLYRRLLQDMDDIYSDEQMWEGFGVLSLSYIQSRHERVQKTKRYVQILQSYGVFWRKNDDDDDHIDDDSSSSNSTTTPTPAATVNSDDWKKTKKVRMFPPTSWIKYQDDNDDDDDDFNASVSVSVSDDNINENRKEARVCRMTEELVSMLYSFESREAVTSAIERASIIERQVRQ